jgi:hypothetical protein
VVLFDSRRYRWCHKFREIVWWSNDVTYLQVPESSTGVNYTKAVILGACPIHGQVGFRGTCTRLYFFHLTRSVAFTCTSNTESRFCVSINYIFQPCSHSSSMVWENCRTYFIPIITPFLTHWLWVRIVPFTWSENKTHDRFDTPPPLFWCIQGSLQAPFIWILFLYK